MNGANYPTTLMSDDIRSLGIGNNSLRFDFHGCARDRLAGACFNDGAI